MRAWPILLLVMSWGLGMTTNPEAQPDSPKAIRLQVREQAGGFVISLEAVRSYPDSGLSREVSLHLNKEPAKITTPDDWRFKLGESPDCGWVVLWSRSGKAGVDSDGNGWITGFTAEFEGPAGPVPAWCKYSVKFEDGTSAGGFTQTVH
jgi:hypothetical protein